MGKKKDGLKKRKKNYGNNHSIQNKKKYFFVFGILHIIKIKCGFQFQLNHQQTALTPFHTVAPSIVFAKLCIHF